MYIIIYYIFVYILLYYVYGVLERNRLTSFEEHAKLTLK